MGMRQGPRRLGRVLPLFSRKKNKSDKSSGPGSELPGASSFKLNDTCISLSSRNVITFRSAQKWPKYLPRGFV